MSCCYESCLLLPVHSRPKMTPFLLLQQLLSTANRFSQFFAHMHAAAGYIVIPPYVIYVTALPRTILTETIFTFTFYALLQKSPFYFEH